MSTLYRIRFEMADGSVDERTYEGPRPRADRESFGPDEIAELLRRDRGAISAVILPWEPPSRFSWRVPTPNAGPLAAVSYQKG